MSDQGDHTNPATVGQAERRTDGAFAPSPGLFAAFLWAGMLLLVQNALLLLALAAGLDNILSTPAILMLPAFIGVSLIVGLKFRHGFRRPLALRGVPWTHLVCLLLWILPLVVVASGLNHWLRAAYLATGVSESLLVPPSFRDALESTGSSLPATVALLVVFVAILPACAEELYFRGFLGRGLVARYGVVGGVLLTAALFGAVHANLVQSVTAATFGVLLHAAFLWSRSLLAPMILHTAYNGRITFLALLPEDSTPGWLRESAPPPWPLLLIALASVAAVFWLDYSMRVRWVLPEGRVWSPGYATAEMPPAELGARPTCHLANKWALFGALGASATFLFLFVREVSR